MTNKIRDKNVGSIEKISQTSDKNVANIEENVNMLKELAENLRGVSKIRRYISLGEKMQETNKLYIMSEYELISTAEAIEEVLAEREQDKKRIQELEEERQLVGIPVRNKRDGKIGIVLHQWENGSIAVLERINPRIINTHDSWNTLEIITDEVKQVQTQDDTISKQAVIDKIKEVRSKRIKHEIDNKLLLDGVREKYLNNKGKFDSCELVTYCIHNEYLGEEHYLQELLEGEK